MTRTRRLEDGRRATAKELREFKGLQFLRVPYLKNDGNDDGVWALKAARPDVRITTGTDNGNTGSVFHWRK